MIGLLKEINLLNNSKVMKNDSLSIVNISKIIDKSYNTVKRKLTNGDFTVEEALKIYRGIGFKAKSDIFAIEYLFTEQGE